LLIGSKTLKGYLARTTRIPLSISPHKNTDLILVDRLESAISRFEPNNLWQNWNSEFWFGEGMRFYSELLERGSIFSEQPFGWVNIRYWVNRMKTIITLGVYLCRPSVRVIPIRWEVSEQIRPAEWRYYLQSAEWIQENENSAVSRGYRLHGRLSRRGGGRI
jgi:hypothetical protein